MENLPFKILVRITFVGLLVHLAFVPGFEPVFAAELRLVNPSSTMSNSAAGRLEVLYSGIWGTVCDDLFTNAAAHVVCYKLGFGRVGSFIQNAFGPGSGQIWLDNVMCNGTEIDIDNCSHNPWGVHDCTHIEDVSISCGFEPVYGGELRLVNPTSTMSNSAAGRLEVLYSGTWGTVCDDFFTNAAAQVVCYKLGFGRVGSFIQNAFGRGSGPILLDNVMCNGTELDIDNCSHNPWGRHDCGHSEDVSISCSGLAPLYADGVRLVNPDSATDRVSVGRLEVLYNGTWGTVCNDFFTDASAHVVCYRLGFGRNGLFIENALGPGSGSIWLDDVRCNGNETDIVNCRRNAWGVNDCGHSEDVSIACEIQECPIGRYPCDGATTICLNTVGSYFCSCRSGYTRMSSTSCTDINECSTSQYVCDVRTTTTCINTAGSYYCSCNNGYSRINATLCSDINECTSGQHTCNATTTVCVNTNGSYYCSCRNGYRQTLSKCTDVNECETGEELCDDSTTVCINNAGSYSCVCRNGYQRESDTVCSDVNECETGEELCDDITTVCINNAGSYYCVCLNGYQRQNDTVCSDVNECETGEALCDKSTTVCINNAGSYYCVCRNGYRRESDRVCLEKSNNRLGVIVGATVGAIVAVALIAILLSVFCWKRRKPVSRQQHANSLGSGVHVSTDTNAYETLDPAALEMKEKEPKYTQLDATTRLPIPPEKPKKIVASYDNVRY